MASPRPSGAPSWLVGLPEPFDNRTVTSTGDPCMCAARVSSAAAGVAVNRPL